MTLLAKIGVLLLLVSCVIGSHLAFYNLGILKGSTTVYSEWQMVKDKTATQVAYLNSVIAANEAVHTNEIKDANDALLAAQAAHAVSLSALRTDLTERLLRSEHRAGVYERMSQGGAADRNNLSVYAARLDRSLEEGRGLAREFGETLKQRDATIRALSLIIVSDRKLLTPQSTDNGN